MIDKSFVCSADGHILEPTDLFRTRLPKHLRHMAVWEVDLASNRIVGSPELNRLLGFPDGVDPTIEEIRARYFPGERERMDEITRRAVERRLHLPTGFGDLRRC